mgnify:CR=1 FL=1
MLLSPTANENPVISRLELVHAIGSLREFFSDGTIDRLQPTGPAAIYTSSVTLWMLVSQRLAGGKSMAATVKDFIADRPTFCPDNKRLDEQTISTQSSAYAGARKRLGLTTAKFLFDRVVDSITHPKVAFGVRPRQTFILD